MLIRPLVLLVPSRAAAQEIPRRLAASGRAITGLYPLTLRDLVRALAEPALLGAGLHAWNSGHDALLAQRLLEDGGGLEVAPGLPRRPLARALARTLSELRREGIDPGHVDAAVVRAGEGTFRAVGALYRRFHGAVAGHFADSAALASAAAGEAARSGWLADAEVLIVGDLEPSGLEKAFLQALAAARPVRRIDHEIPPALRPHSFGAWAARHGIDLVPVAQTALADIAAPPAPPAIARLRASLFEPPAGDPVIDDSVELLTAAGEAAEVRSIVRRLLREAARGVPFEDMGVLMARPHEYAPLFTDLLTRLGIPHRLHPSLPLDFGRSARALLLLFRCRELPRAAVMELFTFAAIPFETLLGPDRTPRPAVWDAISRDAGIVSGLERWRIGLRALAAEERTQAGTHDDPDRKARFLRRAEDADTLLLLVEQLSATLDVLVGTAPWPDWSARLRAVCDTWIGAGRDREAVLEVVADLGGLGSLAGAAPWDDVEAVLEARLEWERLPLDSQTTGAVHVGAFDAMAGLPFRIIAIPGLVEGGYPGVVRPDPFLLDPWREAVTREARAPSRPAATPTRAPERRQLSLFDAIEEPAAAPSPTAPHATLATVDDRVALARRQFHRAVSQATERLILSYPRADARSGRERLPSLFFVSAAAALRGRPLSGVELGQLVSEDTLAATDVDDALDAGERDRIRVRTGGREAALAIAAGSRFFLQSHLASEARWSDRMTAYDGLVHPLGDAAAARLDPVTAGYPISASRLATFAQCGFRYLLQHVLRLEPALEPEERKRLDPMERGSAFHNSAERFLREKRDAGELPVRDDEGSRRRLLAIGDVCLDELVAASPPRFTVLWQKERSRFHQGLLAWLGREAQNAARSTPMHFEVSFGPARDRAKGEPHSIEPLSIDLGDGRTLNVSGKIDRIDKKADGTLVLRDYKTGRAPRDDGGLFRGGRQLQIPFYLLAAERLFPGYVVTEAFLDYVDGGRQVSLDTAALKGDGFRALLRGLVDAIGQGHFVQEHAACEWCDFTAVCGPRPLLERRRRYKINDARVQRVLRMRDVG